MYREARSCVNNAVLRNTRSNFLIRFMQADKRIFTDLFDESFSAEGV